jgi:hypothetical protein
VCETSEGNDGGLMKFFCIYKEKLCQEILSAEQVLRRERVCLALAWLNACGSEKLMNANES